jgi:uncharacterized integral membrane protein
MVGSLAPLPLLPIGPECSCPCQGRDDVGPDGGISSSAVYDKRDVAESSPGQEVEAEKPYPGEQQTRLSGAWTALVIGIVILVVILVFILQNLQSVEVHFLFLQGQLPLAVALLFAMILGAVVVLAFGAGRILQLRLVARRSRHKGTPAAAPAPKPPIE